jgi:hypothetical protein
MAKKPQASRCSCSRKLLLVHLPPLEEWTRALQLFMYPLEPLQIQENKWNHPQLTEIHQNRLDRWPNLIPAPGRAEKRSEILQFVSIKKTDLENRAGSHQLPPHLERSYATPESVYQETTSQRAARWQRLSKRKTSRDLFTTNARPRDCQSQKDLN